jgi:hypothetical protein
VYIEDVGSMHGTYLVDTADNGEFDIQLARGVKTVVSNGDVLRFGVQLSKSAHSMLARGVHDHPNNVADMGLRPPAFRCEMKHFESIDITSPGKSFSVPEGSVNDSDVEILDDDLYGDGGEAPVRSPSSRSEPKSPPPDDAGEDKRRIEMLCAAAHSAEEPFIPESLPSNTQNLWSFGNTPLKRTYDDAQLDVPETAEELGWELEAQSGATVEGPALASVEQPVASVEQPVASSSEQMAIKNLVTAEEEQPATATAEQPSVEMEVQAKPGESEPGVAASAATSSEPPRKRSKIGLAWGVACFLAGSVGTVATLASLPEGYFA